VKELQEVTVPHCIRKSKKKKSWIMSKTLQLQEPQRSVEQKGRKILCLRSKSENSGHDEGWKLLTADIKRKVLPHPKTCSYRPHSLSSLLVRSWECCQIDLFLQLSLS